MFLILKFLFCLFRLVRLEFNFRLASSFSNGSLYRENNPVALKNKVFLKCYREATQMKTPPLLPK